MPPALNSSPYCLPTHLFIGFYLLRLSGAGSMPAGGPWQPAQHIGVTCHVTSSMPAAQGRKLGYWRNMLRYNPAQRDKNGRTW